MKSSRRFIVSSDENSSLHVVCQPNVIYLQLFIWNDFLHHYITFLFLPSNQKNKILNPLT